MDKISTWESLVNISATMLGLLLVVIGMIVSGRQDRRMLVEDARALMYVSVASYIMFLVSLGIGLFILITDNIYDKLRYVGLLYFGLGFTITTVILTLIIVQWIKAE